MLKRTYNKLITSSGLKGITNTEDFHKLTFTIALSFLISRIYYIIRLKLENYHLNNILNSIKDEQESILMKFSQYDEDLFLKSDNTISEEEKIKLLQSKQIKLTLLKLKQIEEEKEGIR